MPAQRAVVVTGGLSGLGAASAKLFAENGWAVHVFDIKPNAENPATGITYHKVNVGDDAEVRSAFDTVAADGVELRCIVHCAGITAFGPRNPGYLVDTGSRTPLDNFETIENVLRTNLLGTFSVVRHGAGLMSRNADPHENGAIVLTSSGAALDGKAGQSAYSASKAGIAGMTLPLARELSELSIRVATIAPGLFDTPILADTPKLERHVPFPPRVGFPHEFAQLAMQIYQNKYLNAEVIRLDGGIRGGFASTTPFVR
ncbi:3-hydroxyacyl-CoA dehydrogenase [Arthrobacter sp. MYb224]|uniref:SDR family NAD(P)-dependent oxidoreductase n=1 Tax=Micrococcaceae TaxID=1268 RepID=UPI000CFC5210|nr:MULTISPECIES: SDR family NAD(P)-dependent oxidoreductase [unclassified Arthrobacter]PRA00219.1 3-hydroxyacyl-CoA dehydrogenase [Arthrobacter sp. MYb224]PRA04394.1 3-hydroxyacyl-CoA dehydrogenase [Arthrobacter sp. MYb229]PRB51692.1 3-hydroxyacyl-CoA dehydrogenase [Arthrobacter sp. MYb216]